MHQFLFTLLQPLTLGFFCTILAMLWLWRRKRGRRRRLIFASIVVLLFAISCTEFASNLGMRALESNYSRCDKLPEDVSTIVVLGGGFRVNDGPNGCDDKSCDGKRRVEICDVTHFRCIHAAKLYHQRGGCLVLASGMHGDPGYQGTPISHLMRDFLIELGVEPSDILVEDRSTSTFENALNSREILSERKIDRIALVTDASHMYRAEHCFSAQGFTVTPAPSSFYAGKISWAPANFLPSCQGANKFQVVIYELQGLILYKLRGRY